ncbi:MAG: glycosyltransferase [Ruminococcus flavefaciens]|nr:glycosyltransferase [Ruminococcus flavefaciens]
MDSYLPHVDGVITCMHNYCLYASKKIDVLAIAPRCKNHVDNLPYRIKRCKSLEMPSLDIQYCQATRDRKFTKEILAEKFDIVHVNSPFNMAKFALKVAKAQNIPAVATFHTNMRPIVKMVVKSKFITEKFIRSLGKRYNKFDEVFVCSPPVAEHCRSFGYTGKISYLPYGTKLEKCNDCERLSAEANRKFSLKEDELFFIYVGRIEKLKRIDFILDSLKILKDKNIKFRFFAVGKGSETKKFKKYKNKLGLTDGEVAFTGFMDAELFPYLYARADLLLFPSLYDNFGLVKVEAAAYDTAGVFIEGSCTGYGVEDGVNGYLSKDTPEAFAEAVERAVADRLNLKQVGKNAGRDIYISWEECADKFVERLEEIVKEHKKKQAEE